VKDVTPALEAQLFASRLAYVQIGISNRAISCEGNTLSLDRTDVIFTES
jgi:hypothetical protein